MPPRIKFFGVRLTSYVRPRLPVSICQPAVGQIASRRGYAEDKSSKPATDPNQDTLGHVSEEAADIDRITGETPPNIEQGTPVQEILQRDDKGKENAPQIIQDEIDSDKRSAGETTFANLLALGQMESIAAGRPVEGSLTEGYKFGLPALPLPPNTNLKHRYDPLVSQVTNLLMKDGKLSVAQRNMSLILTHLRISPAPTANPSRPLLPGSPPASHLPLDPVQYLTLAIDSVAPLLRIRAQRGAAGGGAALQIPVPLNLRQRRRQAIKWILDAASKKKSRGSGKGQFAQRVAEEIVSVVEGRSSAWDRRGLIHKTGTAARANLNQLQQRRR